MQLAIAGQANPLSLPAVARASGNPITSGTVNFYMKAKSGENAGKWWRGSDSSWQASAVIAGAGVYENDDGHWGVSIASDAWDEGVHYLLYLKESGNLHIPVEDQVLCGVVDANGDVRLPTAPVGYGPGSAGSGARTITITVDDGTDPLENAKVRVTNGAESYVGSTNASGQVAFSLDDATWAVAITKALHTFTPTTLAVSDDAAQTYSMEAASIPASAPDKVTGHVTCLDEEGNPEEGVTVRLWQSAMPAAGSGISYDGAVRVETSGADGVAAFANLFPGARYTYYGGDAARPNMTSMTIAADATGTVELNSFIRKD